MGKGGSLVETDRNMLLLDLPDGFVAVLSALFRKIRYYDMIYDL